VPVYFLLIEMQFIDGFSTEDKIMLADQNWKIFGFNLWRICI